MKVQAVGSFADPIDLIRSQDQKWQRMREAMDWLTKSRSVLEGGHFRFGTDEKEQHGRIYVNARRLFNMAFASKWLITALADVLPTEVREQTEIVAGPTTCGIIIARDLADHLSSKLKEGQPDVEAIFFGRDWNDIYTIHESDADRLLVWEPVDPNKPDGEQKVVRGRRVLLVDDVRHRGVTFEACFQLIKRAGGEVIATAQLIDRGMATLPIPVPNYFVGQVDRDRLYKPKDCPMCRVGEPITKF